MGDVRTGKCLGFFGGGSLNSLEMRHHAASYSSHERQMGQEPSAHKRRPSPFCFISYGSSWIFRSLACAIIILELGCRDGDVYTICLIEMSKKRGKRPPVCLSPQLPLLYSGRFLRLFYVTQFASDKGSLFICSLSLSLHSARTLCPRVGPSCPTEATPPRPVRGAPSRYKRETQIGPNRPNYLFRSISFPLLLLFPRSTRPRR